MEPVSQAIKDSLQAQPPSLGRIVHYLAPKTNKPLMAAIIIKVHEGIANEEEGIVDLNVFHPNSGGGHLVPGVKYAVVKEEGRWCYPERVGPKEIKHQDPNKMDNTIKKNQGK